MHKKCRDCQLVNFSGAVRCSRCGSLLELVPDRPVSVRDAGNTFRRRASVCVLVCIVLLAGFYLSLIGSARSLTWEQSQTVQNAVGLLRDKGFSDAVQMLDTFAVFRGTDNWLNASVAKENAYAATNFPFEIITLYPDFFTYPVDDTERAAILLHEAKHLAGKDEHDAYEFVWKHRKQLGWTADKYAGSPVWQNVRQQTRDNVPLLFVCEANNYGDCTQ